MDVALRIAERIAQQLLALRGTGRSFTVEVGDVYYQAASYVGNQVLIEVPAEEFLPHDRYLPPNSEAELLRLGFTRPTAGMPNWWFGVEDGRSDDLVEAAQATTTALLGIYGVPLETLLKAVAYGPSPQEVRAESKLRAATVAFRQTVIVPSGHTSPGGSHRCDCEGVGPVETDDSKPEGNQSMHKPSLPAEYFIPRGGWLPATMSNIGDEAPWNWSIPTLHHSLSDPGGAWVPAVPGEIPEQRGVGAIDLSERLAHVAPYWTGLLVLTWGLLGWVRPDLGIHRWLLAGRPTPEDEPAFRVLERWWGPSARMLVEWTGLGGGLPGVSELVNDQVGGRPTAQWVPETPRAARWPEVTQGGSDPLHLSWHAAQLLCDVESNGSGLLLREEPDAGPGAALVLDQYSGWYRKLSEAGAALPQRPDGRHWRVDVIVRPVGWLGRFRCSDVTGRWFTGRHSSHLLGWNGPSGQEAN